MLFKTKEGKISLIDDSYFPVMNQENVYCLFARHEQYSQCNMRHKSSLCLKEHFNRTTQMFSRQNMPESPAVDN